MRSFIAIESPPELERALEAAAREGARLAPKARWVQPGNFHLTLRFLGEIDEAQEDAIAAQLDQVGRDCFPFDLRVRGAGAFGSPSHPKVLWAGLEGDLEGLGRLYACLDGALSGIGISPEERSFHPHITLARAKLPRGEPKLAAVRETLKDRELGALPVRQIILFKSELGGGGPRHTPLLSVPLHAANQGRA